MAAELKKTLDVDSELVVGGRGVFDVESDGKLIFSRLREGRFPAPPEIIAALRS